MKRIQATCIALVCTLVLFSCSSKSKSASSIAQEWCDLNGKVYKASEGDKQAAENARDKFEKDMEAKYGKDEAFMKEIGAEIEKCEDASEGR